MEHHHLNAVSSVFAWIYKSIKHDLKNKIWQHNLETLIITGAIIDSIEYEYILGLESSEEKLPDCLRNKYRLVTSVMLFLYSVRSTTSDQLRQIGGEGRTTLLTATD